jgi:hypothetical protein
MLCCDDRVLGAPESEDFVNVICEGTSTAAAGLDSECCCETLGGLPGDVDGLFIVKLEPEKRRFRPPAVDVTDEAVLGRSTSRKDLIPVTAPLSMLSSFKTSVWNERYFRIVLLLVSSFGVQPATDSIDKAWLFTLS